jgi:hypothetical protein
MPVDNSTLKIVHYYYCTLPMMNDDNNLSKDYMDRFVMDSDRQSNHDDSNNRWYRMVSIANDIDMELAVDKMDSTSKHVETMVMNAMEWLLMSYLIEDERRREKQQTELDRYHDEVHSSTVLCSSYVDNELDIRLDRAKSRIDSSWRAYRYYLIVHVHSQYCVRQALNVQFDRW